MLQFSGRASWCEMFILLFLTSICLIVGVDYKFAILPLHGGILFAYLLLIIVISIWITFIYIQSLLSNNKPFKYESKKGNFVVKKFKLLFDYVIKKPESLEFPAKENVPIKDIDIRINEFVNDVEIRFILRWYQHISNDPTFPTECKKLLDDVVRRFLQVVIEVDSTKFVYNCIIIFLKHVKEFRKTVKRSERSDGTIEELYRYSHIGSKSTKSMDYYINKLTATALKQFINWELWNSLPCRTLISILSRRFTTYILNFISSPGLLNHAIIQFCSSSETKDKINLNKYYYVSLSNVDHSLAESSLTSSTIFKKLRECNLKPEIVDKSETPVMSPKRNSKEASPNSTKSLKLDEIDSCGALENSCTSLSSENEEFLKPNSTDEVDEAISNAGEVDPKRTASEPVKIYQSNSTKTWRNSSDLECISLGQDILAFEELIDPDTKIQELIEKKLWKDTIDSTEEEKPNTSWDILEPCPADDNVISPTTNLQNYLKSTANTASYITKPIGNVTSNTLNNMKEFQQSTVNTVVKPMSQATSNAMHKIGDLQDEAAGMVEGILDFGMAGLRKGLRLTGLQENFNELAQKARNEFHKPDNLKTIDIPKKRRNSDSLKFSNDRGPKTNGKLVKTPHISSDEKGEQTQSSSESDDSVWINPLIKDSPNFDGNILLEKIPETISTDLIEKPRKLSDSNIYEFNESRGVPKITEEILFDIDSPDPEYEEPQDLASTIAKLRSLLQQKSESGQATPALSPIPQFEMDKTPNEPPPLDPSKVDGAMPSLYKFCARTATGVFQNTLNTIKTALPGNINESNVVKKSEDWTFVEGDSNDDDFFYRMQKLLSERREFCTVDTAYEAIDSLEIVDQPDDATWNLVPISQFDDELDEFDLHIPTTKALIDVICELIGDTKTCLQQETVVKALLLVVGNYCEEIITKNTDSLFRKINRYVGKVPENSIQDVMSLTIEEMVKICLEVFPAYSKTLIGEDTIESGLKLLISSLQSQKINQDIFIQIFELFTSQLIIACGLASPAFSA